MAQDLNKKLAAMKQKSGTSTPGASSSKGEREGKVIIKSKAYMTMLMHVLRFASNKMDPSKWVEVMGVCMGKIEGQDVVVYEAVPIQNGARIEVAWEPTDYAMFAGVDEQYSKKGLFSCGWYHSHPGLKTFLSKVDIKNQLGWQTEANPRGFAIVFDHTYLENPGDLGFRVFRLNDISKGINSDWHEVEYVVEPPEKNSFFQVVKMIVEAGHKKDQSYVKELSETEWSTGVEAGSEGEEKAELQAIPAVSPLTPAIDGFQTGIKALADTFIKTLTSQLEEWTNDTHKAATKGAEPLVEVMDNMKDAVEDGLSRVQQQFEGSLNERVQSLEDSVTETMKKFETGPGNIVGALEAFSRELTQTLRSHLQTRFEEKINEIGAIIGNALDKLNDFSTLAANLNQMLNTQGGKIKSLSNSVNELVDGISNKNQQSHQKMQTTLEDSAKLLGDIIDGMNKEQEKIKAATKDIEAKIKEIKGLL